MVSKRANNQISSGKTDLPLQSKPHKKKMLRQLYDRYWPDICKYVNTTFGSGPPDPEDIAQTVFTKFASLEDPSSVLNPRAFLYRSAHNEVVSYHRKSVTRRRYMMDQKNGPEENSRDDIHPERILITRERLALLERVMWDMPVKRRKMLIMNRFDGLTYAEISRRTGLSQSAVKKHIMMAMRDFNMMIQKSEIVSDAPEIGK